MEKYAVIVAGGSGVRMGGDMPKQFLLLNGKSLLWHSVNVFVTAFPGIHIIIVLPAEHIDRGKKAVAGLELSVPFVYAPGGNTRFESVKKGLRFAAADSVIFVHDAARCLSSETLLQRCFAQAIEKGSAVPAVAATDSIRLVKNGGHEALNRNDVLIVQTPQTFLGKILLPAFVQTFDDSFTDEATVVEASGVKVFLIEGEYENIKITRPADMLIAEGILMNRSSEK